MNHAGEKGSHVLEHKRIMRQARHHLRNRHIEVSDHFKKSLLVASNAIQAARMLENLHLVLERKRAEQAVDFDTLEEGLAEAQPFFDRSIEEYNEEDILNAESLIEHLTLSHDPMYLEGEEIRKRAYFQEHKKMKRQVTWTSNPSSRFFSLLKGDLQGVEEVSEEEQRSCISKCAWGFAIVGMTIAIAFLIVDFWQSQANPALSTSLIQNEKLSLPVIYGCLTMPMVPAFENLPNDTYKGYSPWGLRSYSNADTNDSLLYPKTKFITEHINLGRQEYCSQALQYLSAEAISESLGDTFDPTRKCYSCLKIGSKIPLELSREAALRRSTGAITLEFASSNTLEVCFNIGVSENAVHRTFIKDALKTHGQELLSRGIIDLVNSPSLDFAFDLGFDSFDSAFPDDDGPRLTAETTVLCNLYFFSGYFFPVKPGTEVRYSFDHTRGLKAWQPVGNSKIFQVPVSDRKVAKKANRTTILAQIREEDVVTASTETAVNIYAVDNPQTLPHIFRDYAVALRQNHRDVLLFTKTIENGIGKYSSEVQRGAHKVFRAIQQYRRYNISLDFTTFETEDQTRRPTTSVPEFLTDLFEYVGLFTGICAYSVLVGPARMYLKSSNKRNQHNLREGRTIY